MITGDNWLFTYTCMHRDTHTHNLVSKHTYRVQTHDECKQTYITMPLLQVQRDMSLAPTQSATYFKSICPWPHFCCPHLDIYYSHVRDHTLHYMCMCIYASGDVLWTHAYETHREIVKVPVSCQELKENLVKWPGDVDIVCNYNEVFFIQ